MLKNLRYTHMTWLSALIIAPGLLADCGAGPISLGDAGSSNAGSGTAGSGTAGSGNAGSGNGGSGNAGANTAGSTAIGGGSGGTDATCANSDCGPALGLANYQCADGSTAGPTGRCLKRDNGTCGWEILSCPIGAGGSGGTSAGAGGQATGGDSGQTCGGKVCGADQRCCGPASCGRCIPAASGQACPDLCAGGSGGTNSGGASGSGGSGGANCPSLLAGVQSTLATAQTCNPASAAPLKCAGTLEGLCCPVLVEAPTTTTNIANTAYLSALHTYKQNCSFGCLATLCRIQQPGNCITTQASTIGACGGGTGS